MDTVESRLKVAGATREDDVAVDVSYDIIRHVSAQLYTNPRKAIEELICNSYDAGAKECWVRLPQAEDDFLAVLDNGNSMDVAGLKSLWRVAYSPKNEELKNGERIQNNRFQIGKFGVGKLAAFALGKRLTHVTCIDNEVRIVSVGQDQIKGKGDGKPPTFSINHLELEKAKPALEPYLKELVIPWEKGWSSWTLALVEEIDKSSAGSALKPGYLKRMVKTALPLSARFSVFLERDLVPKREIPTEDISIRVDVTDVDFQKKLEETLQAHWQEVLGEKDPGSVPTKYFKVSVGQTEDPQDTTQTIEALIVPELGAVIGSAVITKNSLTSQKLIERGYADNGFAVYTHGKLVNPENELFGISQRSHKYWSKFLAILEIPGLDKVILVQRNDVSENSPEAQVTREVLRALFNYVRNKAEDEEATEGYRPDALGMRLNFSAPILVPLAISGLFKGNVSAAELKAFDIGTATLGVAAPAARFDPASKQIQINDDHPLLDALDDLGSKSKPLRRVISEILAGFQLVRGLLLTRGINEETINEVDEVIDASLRSAAGFVKDEVELHIGRIEEASLIGKKPFENAVEPVA